MTLIAVASTGIYCRSGCPAPAPRATNVGRVPTAAAARAAGYRACKRCHPDDEIAPARGGISVTEGSGSECDLTLPYQGRRNLRALLDFLAARAIPEVEAVTAGELIRTLRLDNGVGIARVTLQPGRVRCRTWVESADDDAPALAKVRSLLDLDRDLTAIETDLRADAQMASLMKGRRGTGVAGTVDGFELAVRAILGQQVTVAGARTLAGRVVAAFGTALPRHALAENAHDAARVEVTRVFPAPERLAEADLAALGMPRSRAEAIRALARRVAAGDIDLSASAGVPEVRTSLLAIPGVGPWTAGYVAMRAQRDPDAFLPSDLGVRKAMVALGVPDDPRAIGERAERWRPWRAYALQYLWAGSARSHHMIRLGRPDRLEGSP